MKLRWSVIKAIFLRNLTSYFSGVLGYLFIILFVVAAGFFAFDADFFTANEPNLDQLSEWYPVLLLFFIPAITMSVWAEEKKMGTDELLFTLPASELEILIGKYLSVVAVYTVALVFSMTHMFVLAYLGNPDWGLILATYFGYWLAGCALLSAGMLASQFTRNITVAFVVGVVILLIPVSIGPVSQLIGLGELLEQFSLDEQFRDLSMGVIPFDGLLYFVFLTAFMLYLNYVVMTRRHWAAKREVHPALQFTVRAVALATIFACATTWASYSTVRIDATQEKQFSLSTTTREVLRKLDPERPIEIQVFISKEVPPEYVETRKRLIGLLRQYDELAGKNLEVRYVEVEPFSPQAEEAEHFGIEPVQVFYIDRDGRRAEAEIFLGAVVISSYDKVVIPFFGKGLPIEYELTRSVQTVANETRHRVGVLQTDAALATSGRQWQIVRELKKQYIVEEVSPATEIDGSKFDVLLVGMPSSLTEPEMDNLVQYVKSGRPVVLFDDPFPLTLGGQFGVSSAPRQPKTNPHAGMFGGSPPPEPKADGGRATRLLEALGIEWPYDQVVFDFNNPHPEYGNLPAEYVFITSSTKPEEDGFNRQSPITRGLEELIALYPGFVQQRSSSGIEFTPLLLTSYQSGVLKWEEFVDESGFNFFAMSAAANPKRNPPRRIDANRYCLAAYLHGEEADAKINAVFVTDIDMISDFFFEERTMGNLSMKFDNVTFVLNAIDFLVGDESFIELRSRREKHRTLDRVERMKKVFLEQANKAEREADRQAEEELEKRREQLQARVKEIQENQQLDPIAKAQLVEQAQQAEQQRLSLAEAQIEQEKNNEIQKIRATTNRQVKLLEWRIRLLSILLPAIPAVLVGVIMLAIRLADERRSVSPDRRRKDS
ncbi:MAG: ABC transporter permease [Pirellulaceae bacterium]|nr:MAG: ABC transporter permease [Pirellulaceae bacterium]